MCHLDRQNPFWMGRKITGWLVDGVKNKHIKILKIIYWEVCLENGCHICVYS